MLRPYCQPSEAFSPTMLIMSPSMKDSLVSPVPSWEYTALTWRPEIGGGGGTTLPWGKVLAVNKNNEILTNVFNLASGHLFKFLQFYFLTRQVHNNFRTILISRASSLSMFVFLVDLALKASIFDCLDIPKGPPL